jgi:hypothetical protein
MPSHIIVRIELTPPAKKALESLTTKAGMTQVAMLSQLVEWLAQQSGVVQAAVLSPFLSETQTAIARLIFKELASGKKG